MVRPVRRSAIAATTYQAMVAADAVAGGVSRSRLIPGAYQASAMTARLTGAATAPPRSA
jgi:hypothetical protein